MMKPIDETEKPKNSFLFEQTSVKRTEVRPILRLIPQLSISAQGLCEALMVKY